MRTPEQEQYGGSEVISTGTDFDLVAGRARLLRIDPQVATLTITLPLGSEYSSHGGVMFTFINTNGAANEIAIMDGPIPLATVPAGSVVKCVLKNNTNKPGNWIALGRTNVYKLTECVGLAVSYTNTDLGEYIDKVIRLDGEPDECYLVENVTDSGGNPTPSVVVDPTTQAGGFDDCVDCGRGYLFMFFSDSNDGMSGTAQLSPNGYGGSGEYQVVAGIMKRWGELWTEYTFIQTSSGRDLNNKVRASIAVITQNASLGGEYFDTRFDWASSWVRAADGVNFYDETHSLDNPHPVSTDNSGAQHYLGRGKSEIDAQIALDSDTYIESRSWIIFISDRDSTGLQEQLEADVDVAAFNAAGYNVIHVCANYSEISRQSVEDEYVAAGFNMSNVHVIRVQDTEFNNGGSNPPPITQYEDLLPDVLSPETANPT